MVLLLGRSCFLATVRKDKKKKKKSCLVLDADEQKHCTVAIISDVLGLFAVHLINA